MANLDVRQYAKQKGVKLWQCAAAMGISEPTMTRRMRTELPDEGKQQFIRIIDELAAQRKSAAG